MKINVKKVAEGHYCDIRVEFPDGRSKRERRTVPITSKTDARRWAENRALEILRETPKPTSAPTLEAFWPEFVKGHEKANRQKHGTSTARDSHYRTHLKPMFGSTPLDQIGAAEIQKLKGSLGKLAPKTVNNILTDLSVVLKAAAEWGKIKEAPKVKLVKVDTRKKPDFYEEDILDRLLDAAEASTGESDLALVLLGADAGLRRGEVIGLEWNDVDFIRKTLTISRNVYRGVVGTTKGGKTRVVPMTPRLAFVLQGLRHLRGERVFYDRDGHEITEAWVYATIRRVERLAGLPKTGRYHKLRHTFCTRLAMRGVPARVIQALAGHESIETTNKYLHVVQGAPEDAIRALSSSPTATVATDGQRSSSAENPA